MQNLCFHLLTQAPQKKELHAFQKDAGWPLSEIGLTKPGDPRSRVQWVGISVDQRRIAIARLELAPACFCFVSELIIKSSFRRKGVGRWFMKNIEQLCLQLTIPRVLLVADQASLPFYQRLAFAPDPLVPGHLKKDINPFQAKMLRTQPSI
jgi:GNAT superfamily N-acetyltransferase